MNNNKLRQENKFQYQKTEIVTTSLSNLYYSDYYHFKISLLECELFDLMAEVCRI